MRNFIIGCLTLLAVAFLGAVVGFGADGEGVSLTGAVSTGYKLDKQTAYFRDNVAVVDTAATTCSYTNCRLIPTNSNLAVSDSNRAEFENGGPSTGVPRQNIPVSGRFSASGANCKIRLVAFYVTGGVGYLLGVSDEITLTAHGTIKDENGRFLSPTFTFDSYGANILFVIVTGAPSSGTVAFAVGSH